MGVCMSFPCGAPTLASGRHAGPPCRNLVLEGQRTCAAGHQVRSVATLHAGTVREELPSTPATLDADELLASTHSDDASFVRQQGARLGMDVDATLSDAADDEDVEWSTNDWCLSKTGMLEAADVVALRPGPDGEDQVLLIRRSHPPFASTWALPGGMRDPGESLQDTAARELEEETGLAATTTKSGPWLGEAESADWDIRFTRSRVGARLVRADADAVAFASDDAIDAQWISLDAVSRGEYPMAFGHAEWLRRATVADSRQPDGMATRFELLVQAENVRNRRLIRRINEVRAERGAPLIPEE